MEREITKREIKFRAWDSKNKVMLIQGNECDENRKIFWEKWETTSHMSPPMQFTGLKDKNGVGAYYGDIIEHSTTEGGIFTRVISWDNELQCTMIDNMPYYRLHESGFIQPSKLEFIIIGNIYENPELLTP